MSAGPELPLLSRYPRAAARLPRVPLCRLPTPVMRAEKTEREARTGPLYVKRDDQSAELYGGNKPRKLEWILARARSRGASRVLTFGGLGTNHGLATALYAARLGIACDLVLLRQPLTDAVRRRLLQQHAAGAHLFWGGSVLGGVATSLGRWLRHPRVYTIPPGGSSAHGVLGFVNAGLELAEQIAAGELLEPARLYVACGTGGSAAGLALGLALAGLRTQVVAVLVTDILPPTRSRLQRVARAAFGLLRGAGAENAAPELSLELERSFLGGGYGRATPAGEAARRLAEQLDGLRLDPTYTGKALAALLSRERGRTEPVLFWNTYAAREPELELPDPSELPRAFQRFFREPD